jgi:hypothetical protein
MKLITYLGQTFCLLIAFSILIVHNDYWDLPMIIVIFLGLLDFTSPYLYPILPFLPLGLLIYTLVRYGKQTCYIWKYIINIGAYLLLVGSRLWVMHLDGRSIENLFSGFLPSTTLTLFCIVSVCFLMTNVSGLIKLLHKKPGSLN